jgi:hypothetical protein
MVLGGLFCLAVRTTQVRPIDIGAKILTANNAVGGALNHWATLRWHTPGTPVGNVLWRNADGFGECRKAAGNLDRLVNCFHGKQYYTQCLVIANMSCIKISFKCETIAS